MVQPDVQNNPDGGDQITPPMDVRTDGMADRVVPADAPDGGANTCRMIAVEDLNALGMVSGDTLTFMGDNRMAADSTAAGLQPAAGSTTCAFRTTRQRIFRYTVRGNAALRLTTTNPGTDLSFDTTLAVANGPTCTNTTQVRFCNDDDPQQQGDDRRVSSLVTTDIKTAGTVVYIGLGGFVGTTGARNVPGETGNFVLTVRELVPVAMGGTCDVLRQDNICADSTTCVPASPTSLTGTCRANGSVASAACDTAAGTCMGTLMCDTTNGNVCFDTVADGMPCERFTDAGHRCGANSSCVNLQRGSVTGVCRANGSLGASCTAAGACADSTLRCTGMTAGSLGICVEALTAGAMCRTWDQSCPMDQGCLPVSSGGTPGTCTALGTTRLQCTTAGTCTAPATCVTPATGNPVCLNTAMSGMACGPGDQCPTGDNCYLTNPGDRFHGICRTPGTAGGNCNTAGMACAAGLTCSDAMTPANGRCLTEVAVGGACTIFGTTNCAMNSTCVPTMAHGLTGTCVADGTAGGTACRTTAGMPRCDGMLQCTSTTTTGGGTCQAPATTACDPRWGTTRCPTGQACRATGYETGTCAAPGTETEPNDVAAMGQMIATLPASVRGSLTRFDTDCYRFAVPANGRVFARANSALGLCPGGTSVDPSLDLYDPAGHLLGGDTNGGAAGCPRIDGSDTTAGNYGWASNLAAGTYTVCVRNAATPGGTPMPEYVLDINAM